MADLARVEYRGEDQVAIRPLSMADLASSLSRGWDDFTAVPTHGVLVALIYPVIGLLLFRGIFHYELLPLIFPMIAGFALLGPVAAIGFYEISRLRERGTSVTWRNVLGSLSSRSLAAIGCLSFWMVALFVAWIGVAYAIYLATMSHVPIVSVSGFFRDVFATDAGVRLLTVGNIAGAVFALVALAISVVSFPMLIDRDVDAVTAAATSVRVVWRNPGVMLTWGAIVTAILVAALLPALIGLAVALPVLGHATWHLYRRAVV